MPIKKIFKPFRNEILKFIFYAKVQHNRTKPYCICFKLSSKNHSEAKMFLNLQNKTFGSIVLAHAGQEKIILDFITKEI